MKNKFVKVSAALTAFLMICAGTSCGKVDQKKDDKKVVVSGTEDSEKNNASDHSDADSTTDNSDKTTDPSENQTGTVPGTTDKKGHTASGSDKPVSGQPSGTVPNGSSGTGNSGNGSQVTDISLTFYEVTLPIGGSKMPIVTMLPADAPDKGEIWTSSDESVAIVDAYGNITGVGEGNCTVTVASSANPEVKANVNVKVEAAPDVPVADGVTYIDGILIANKSYALPASYNPGGLTGECSAAFQQLVNGAAADNINIYLSSGFRSYDYQAQIYNNYVAMDGQANADTYSARPGHSEHQTGLAIDCNIIDDSFTGTPEAIWLENHCHEYGFIIRYPKSKESITGYKYEPWHIRYLGVEKAKAVHDSGLCLEEYLNITSQYNY